MSDDTPTDRLAEATEELADERRKSSTLMIVLIAVAAVLLVGLVVLGVLLFTRPAENTAAPAPATTETSGPSASPTPSETPTATPATTTEPAPVVTVTAAPPNDGNVRITGFTISPTTVNCSDGNTDNDVLTITWQSQNGNVAYFGVGTTDAQSGGMGWSLPPSGDTRDFPEGYHPFFFNCSEQSQYTITVVGNGSKQSRTVTVRSQ